MANKIGHFCTECHEETDYIVQKVKRNKIIREKEYEFEIYEAFCQKCGNITNVNGLIDFNVKEMDRQYRLMENIVLAEDINKMMEIYNIGKAPLSLALGFGEITITRYLMGQIPSKEYSDIIKKALQSPDFMITKLNENIDKIGETAYKKSIKAAKELESIFRISEKMLLAISYIFNKANEVTPLALQKLLYYIQGIYMVLFDEKLFDEDCEAWAHGPVFRNVYEVFKNFKYNPIDDTRFAMLQYRFSELSDHEKKVIDLVMDTFGIYSGGVLERITHKEQPWIKARVNCMPGEASNEIISKESIKKYFKQLTDTYRLDSEESIREYIIEMI